MSQHVPSPASSGYLSSVYEKVRALAEAFPWMRPFLPALPHELTQQALPSAPQLVGQGHKQDF